MITLTAPHFLLPHVVEGSPLARRACRDTTTARVWALRLAWPMFLRRLSRHWKGNPVRDRVTREWSLSTPETVAMLPRYEETSTGARVVVQGGPPYHRAFEWTPGSDGLGHPHYHVWTFCPWIDAAIVQAMWAEALAAVGVPLENGYVRVTVQVFQDVNVSAARELMKGGRAGAIKLSRLARRGAPKNAFAYADGWTIAEMLEHAHPDVVASLYCALEGMRLAQASRAFFGTVDPPECEYCGHHFFRVRFEPREHHQPPCILDHARAPP